MVRRLRLRSLTEKGSGIAKTKPHQEQKLRHAVGELHSDMQVSPAAFRR
jgi:hypothetical protein